MTRSLRDEEALLSMAFSLHSSPGAYALLLGAGVSAPSGIPTAWGVLIDLITRLAEVQGDSPDDPVRWYEDRYDEPPRYETLLEKLAPTPLERQRLLKDYFEPSAEDVEAGRKQPTVAHRAIARLVRTGTVKVIVTLNFDRLVEQALRAEGIEPTVIASPADVAGMAPLHTLECCVVHLHGDYLNPTSMLNTTDELATYAPGTLKLLERILEDYGLIIAGWSSVYDPALRGAVAVHYSGRLTLAWMEPGPVTHQAAELRTLKKGVLVSADADTGFGQLVDAVDALRTRKARHPLTLSIAVETAKRELSGGRVAIGLHDTVRKEFTRLHEHADFRLPDYHSNVTDGDYEAILARVEEASTICCGLVATLAYWGDENTGAWWLDELERFATPTRGSGLTRLLRVRTLAGTALLYSAGTAAVAAQRYSLLRQMLFASRINPHHGRRESLVAVLRSDEAYPESPSDPSRLYQFLEPVLREALAMGTDPFDEAWQRFELIKLALAVMTDPEFDEIYRSLPTGPNSKPEVAGLARRVHSGRIHVLTKDYRLDEAYRSPIAERLADDLEAEQAAHPLVRGGLAQDPHALATALRAVSRALGTEGRELAWKRVLGRAGIIPSEMWLDSGKTPDELSSHRP
ncbi:SIR2 family protein [Actinomadura hibisca]|uniref:SIR2 family protein n=1 Tax=Actinomadura hibisca TaxID=68565 RepID=UPI001472234D|nr:SIR2 family protein [Actinomadura hibisca]